jgi:electron transport complex protein RnfC
MEITSLEVLGENVLAMKRLRGVHVEHRKNTSGSVPKRIPTPAKVWIPMSQHIGAPCSPVVKVGDLVEVGQLIGNAAGFVSAPIHASVSGKVTAIEDIVLSGGQVSQAVVITSDGQQTVSSSVVPPVVETFEQFTAAIRASGVVGLGGAGFHVGQAFAEGPVGCGICDY